MNETAPWLLRHVVARDCSANHPVHIASSLGGESFNAVLSRVLAIVNSYKVGRNDLCPCGSGKKFKKCCLNPRSRSEPSSGLHRVDPQTREDSRSALEQELGATWRYDPFLEPHPDQWLALDEQERIDAVLGYHRRARIRLPRQRLHAVVHVIVENQMADAELPVRRTAQRLMSEGLDRHEAVHAIGSVLTGHLNDLMHGIKSGGDDVGTGSNQDPNKDYFTVLEALTAEGWLRSA
ncbi:SEC-C metal-binding domain-containing protein [Bradyrhizobium sp. cf659]|uniref:SEC-C metal-binding domain-containing protein n=1 Tax=Bradyrhizobium sp. cf659 TaxID=1761771 RepID=UPI001FCCCAD7|nr:SEC-C metal-binding domain-containing protein [Bradyrhizobium sp. cf659]